MCNRSKGLKGNNVYHCLFFTTAFFLESFHGITMVEKKEHFVLCCKERTLIYWKSTSLEVEKTDVIALARPAFSLQLVGKRSFRGGVIHKCKRRSCSLKTIETQCKPRLDNFIFKVVLTLLHREGTRISDCKSILIVDRLHGVLAKNSEPKLKID